MKSNTKKRLIAFMLCMVLVLSSATSAFADEPQNTDSQSQTEVVTEPVADEAQNTDSQSQAEVVTEPAADEATEDTTTEDTTTEDTTTEDTTTEDVSTENTITEDVSDTPDIEIPSKKEWSVQVGNATVKVNGSADALPADAQLSVTEITSEDEVKEIEKAVEEKAIEEQFSIKNIFSYDIKFLVNGSEVQPTTPVQVSVDTPEITSSENAAVLHVDDNNVAEDMKGAVDGEGKVVFDAPHFSKYVIVQKGNSKVTEVTVTDTLTDEVELADQKLQVVVKDETGKVINKLKNASGNEVDVSKIITVSTAKDSNGKTQIIMRFEPNYKLESGYTYYVTAKIQPTTKAYLKYQNESYTDTGDENTDEYLGKDKKPGKDTKNEGTSSEENGFYSNVSANVTYKYNNETYTKPYAKPVIQVDASTVSHTVVKQWEKDLDKVAVDVKLKAYVTEAEDSKISVDNPKYLTNEDVKNLPTSIQVNLSETNNWTHTWENLPTKYFYETADGSIKETDIHYTVEEVQTDATKAFYGQVTESSV